MGFLWRVFWLAVFDCSGVYGGLNDLLGHLDSEGRLLCLIDSTFLSIFCLCVRNPNLGFPGFWG